MKYKHKCKIKHYEDFDSDVSINHHIIRQSNKSIKGLVGNKCIAIKKRGCK